MNKKVISVLVTSSNKQATKIFQRVLTLCVCGKWVCKLNSS